MARVALQKQRKQAVPYLINERYILMIDEMMGGDGMYAIDWSIHEFIGYPLE
jgi:hypothetical protein